MRLHTAEYVVPALPGFYWLIPIEETDGTYKECSEVPIVAWRITSAPLNQEQSFVGRAVVNTDPITPEGGNIGDIGAVLLPDGRVLSPHDQTFATPADYIEYLNATRQRRAA
jgi:hypothetical protein